MSPTNNDTGLRDRIAREGFLEFGEPGDDLVDFYGLADRILAIPEIAEALTAQEELERLQLRVELLEHDAQYPRI